MAQKLKILLLLKICLGLCSAIASDEDVFGYMSVDERRSFFDNDDGSIPDYQLVELKKTSRSKRATNSLNIDFRDENGLPTTATVYQVPDQELITRSTTGLWFAEASKTAYHGVTYTPQPDVLERIGDLTLFQNVAEVSAVTRYLTPAGDEVISGVLRQDYSVRNLPQGPDDGYASIVRSRVRRSANSTKDDDDDDSSLILVIYKNPKIPEEYLRLLSRAQNSTEAELERQRRKRRAAGAQYNVPNVVYPKLLITPDYSLISEWIKIDDYVRRIVTHFNAVDMIYRQLSNPAVRLKIAGIIVAMDEYATPYIAENTVTVPSIIANNVLGNTRQYFLDEEHRFPFDSYDVVIMLTRNKLWAIDGPGKLAPILGQSMIATGCFIGRGIATFNKGFIGIVNLAHELGHVFGVLDAPNTQCPDSQGFLMGSSIGAVRTLRWSRCSQQEFSSYFSSQEAHCMHNPPLPKPLSVAHMQGTWMPLWGQCDNYVNAPNTVTCHTAFADGLHYGCSTHNKCVHLDNFPMEGTELGEGRRWINGRAVVAPS